MPGSHSGNFHATDSSARQIIVLPGSAADVLAVALRERWLDAAVIRLLPRAVPLLDRLLLELGQPAATEGRAALRLWGQTGAMPAGWVAAADPVWMEAGREQLFLHVPPQPEIDAAALAEMLQDLQDSLLVGRSLRFEAHQDYGYLRGASALPVAALPATSIDRGRPGAFMPDFAAAGAADFYSLNSEIEMSLFAHAQNLAREERGQRPLNALWLWGGGTIESVSPRRLPTILSDEPLLRGFAACSESPAQDWPGNVRRCVELAGNSFVAAPSFANGQQLQELFAEIGTLWRERLLRRPLILLDDVAIEQVRSWRRFTRFGGRATLEKLLHEQQ